MNQYLDCTEFKQGYDAAALCEPYDNTLSQDWQDGWKAYQDDMDSSELLRYSL